MHTRPEVSASRVSSPGLPPAPRYLSVPPFSQPKLPDASDLLHDTVYRRARRAATAVGHRLDAALSSVGRRDTKRILFEAASPLSFAIFGPVYERLARDKRIEFWFTASSQSWSPESLFGGMGITERVISARVASWMKVDAYVNTDFWDDTWMYRRTKRIHLFHGVAGKYGLDAPVDIAPTVRSFDCLMFPNHDRLARYVEAGLVAAGTPAAALVGYPKVDCLVNGTLDASAIAARLELDRRIPIVMYAPTWSPHSSLNTTGEAVIDALVGTGVQVIVKLHDRSYDLSRRASGGVDWAARLRRFEGHRSVRVVRDSDACPYLFVADVLVTGHSSIGFEYMLLDRPLVVIEGAELIRSARINPEKVASLRSAAAVAATPEDTVRAVHGQLKQPARQSEQRRRVASELFYRPGTATGRATALMYELLQLSAPAAAIEADPRSDTSFASFGSVEQRN
jgi:hypothetical protein